MSSRVFDDPDLHDGRLTAIMLLDAGLELRCETMSGRRVTFTLAELEDLRVEGFREGNVVFEVRSGHYGASEEDAIRWLHDGNATRVTTAFSEGKDQGWQLFEVDCSYGCRLVALFKGDLSIDVAELP